MAVTGVILAGGQARRMGGGDKCLRLLGGRPILAHIIERVRPQVAHLVLSANGDPARFAAFGLEVVADPVPGSVGPLAGILAALDWAAERARESTFIASFPADTPFVPSDLVSRLVGAALGADADLAWAVSNGQRHPATAVWRVGLREDLRAAITVEKLYRIADWTCRYRLVEVPFAVDAVDPFLNINRAADLEAAERFLAGSRVT
jgi:molybdenum cofactor guanylyltransferase